MMDLKNQVRENFRVQIFSAYIQHGIQEDVILVSIASGLIATAATLLEFVGKPHPILAISLATSIALLLGSIVCVVRMTQPTKEYLRALVDYLDDTSQPNQVKADQANSAISRKARAAHALFFLGLSVFGIAVVAPPFFTSVHDLNRSVEERIMPREEKKMPSIPTGDHVRTPVGPKEKKDLGGLHNLVPYNQISPSSSNQGQSDNPGSGSEENQNREEKKN